MRRQLIVYTALCAFAACRVVGPAWAQPTAMPTGPTAPIVAEGAENTSGEPATRGLFLLALIPIFAELVGKTGGNVIDALFGKVKPSPTNAQIAKPAVSIDQLAVNGNYYAGIAYTAYLVTNEAEPVRVDAATYQFHTGDQFFVRYVANMPGRLDVSNVNPRGQETRLGTWPVSAGQQGTIPAQGTFQFTGDSGDEGMRLAFTPCTSGAATRDISINSTATVNYGGLLPVCSERTLATRDIQIKSENGVGYAVAQLDKQELKAGAIETRLFMIRFRHARPAAASRDWLVSPEEADQAPSRALVVNKSDPEGPTIDVRVPGEIKEVTPPVTIDVKFEPKEGHEIDFKSLKVTYMKLFDIDITDRMKPYLTPTGIHSDNAKLPPGDHTIEITVKDDAGKKTVEHFSFKVLKP